MNLDYFRENECDMDIIGKIKLIREEQAFASGFTKREFVITSEDKYPQDISFELLKEKGSLINGYNDGDRLKVFFEIRGREYNGKYYNSLVAWKLEKLSEGSGSSSHQSPAPPNIEIPADNAQQDDDLPF